MVGRNDPCPCGSGKKYKKCCERVVAIQAAEQIRENREIQIKKEILKDLKEWFERHVSREEEKKWEERFKEIMRFPTAKPLPSKYTHAYRFWLMLDAPCVDGRRPIDVWREASNLQSDRQELADQLRDVHLGCYEVCYTGNQEVILQPILGEGTYVTKVFEPLHKGDVLIGRLSRLGNRYELFGPYTVFTQQMRGEILMHLENQVPRDPAGEREFWRQNGLHVLGWAMHRAKEWDQLSTQAQASREEAAPTAEVRALPSLPSLKEEEKGLPDLVTQQLELFFMNAVSEYQPRTQALFARSLEYLVEYISLYFGKSFTWSRFNEDVLAHFCGVWYVDRVGSNAVKAKIFLNTIKHLFRWLDGEGIETVYAAYRRVYPSLIQSLPLAFEVRKWLVQHGVQERTSEESAMTGTYLLAVPPSGPVLLMGKKWLPLNLRGFPPNWAEYRFWLKGTVANDGSLHRVEAVYPVLLDDWEQTLEQTMEER